MMGFRGKMGALGDRLRGWAVVHIREAGGWDKGSRSRREEKRSD